MWVNFRVPVNPDGPYDVAPAVPWSPHHAANVDTLTWATAWIWVNPAGTQPGDVAPTAFQSPPMYATAELSCARVTDTVFVAVPCAFDRTNPVLPPHAEHQIPRIADRTWPAAAVTAPDPELPAVACQACAQQLLDAARADPSAENVNPVAVGVAIVLAVSSVTPSTRIRSPEFHVSVPDTSDDAVVSVHVDDVCEVSVGAGMATPNPPKSGQT